MKKILTLILFCFLLQYSYSQNGTFYSNLFQFYSENEPHRNRISHENNTLVFQITERQGEFITGKVLWEMQSGAQSGWLEMQLKRLKNAQFDESTNAFVRSFAADVFIDGAFLYAGEVNIWYFSTDNNYRVDLIDTRKKTINSWSNLKKTR